MPAVRYISVQSDGRTPHSSLLQQVTNGYYPTIASATGKDVPVTGSGGVSSRVYGVEGVRSQVRGTGGTSGRIAGA